MSGQWIKCKDQLPPNATPVLIYIGDEIRVGEIRTEVPTFEESFAAFDYWDDPYDDGQEWEWHDVTHWMKLPEEPTK